MADVIKLLSQPLRLAYSTGYPRLETAVDVLQYDRIDLDVTVVGFEVPGASPNIMVSMLTGLQLDTNDGWLTVGNTATLTTAGASGKIVLAGNFLRYIRWQVVGGGTQAATTIWIRGLGRRLSDS